MSSPKNLAQLLFEYYLDKLDPVARSKLLVEAVTKHSSVDMRYCEICGYIETCIWKNRPRDECIECGVRKCCREAGVNKSRWCRDECWYKNVYSTGCVFGGEEDY